MTTTSDLKVGFLPHRMLNYITFDKYCEGVFCCYATCHNEIGWNVG
jgi:hypothetical protein